MKLEETIKVNGVQLEPCVEAMAWLRTQATPASAWTHCERGDWMLWLLTNAGLLTAMQDLELQLALLETPLADGRTVLDLVTDERSLAFIALKRRKLAGEQISLDAWTAAWDTAWDAAWAAVAAASDAASAARDAAWDAVWAAVAAALAWQADKVRAVVSNPFVEEKHA